DPGEGEEEVDRAAIFRVFFDRPILPADVHRGNVTLQSGAVRAYLGPRFDPVDRVLVVENLGAPLDPSVVWRLSLENIRDFERRPMEPWTTQFRIGEDATGETRPPAPTFADVSSIF